MVHRSGSSIALAPTSLNSKTTNDSRVNDKKCDLKKESSSTATATSFTPTTPATKKKTPSPPQTRKTATDEHRTAIRSTSLSASAAPGAFNKRSSSVTATATSTVAATAATTTLSERAQTTRSIQQKALSPPITPNDANLRTTPTARGRSRSVVHSVNPPTSATNSSITFSTETTTTTSSTSSSSSLLQSISTSSTTVAAAATTNNTNICNSNNSNNSSSNNNNNNNSSSNKRTALALRQCTPTPPIRNRRSRLSVDFDIHSDASSNCSSILSSITSSTRSGLRSHSLENTTIYHNNNNNNTNNNNNNNININNNNSNKNNSTVANKSNEECNNNSSRKSKSITPKKLTQRKSSNSKFSSSSSSSTTTSTITRTTTLTTTTTTTQVIDNNQISYNRSTSNNRSSRNKCISNNNNNNNMKKCQSMDSVFQSIRKPSSQSLNDDIITDDDDDNDDDADDDNNDNDVDANGDNLNDNDANNIDNDDNDFDVKPFANDDLMKPIGHNKLSEYSTKLTCSVPLDRLSSGILATLVSKYKSIGNCDDDPDDEKESSIISSNSSSISLPSAPSSILSAENQHMQHMHQSHQQQQHQKSLCLYCDKKFSSQKIRIIHTERVHTLQGSAIAKTRRISSRSTATTLSSSLSNLTNLCGSGSNNATTTNSTGGNLTKKFHSGCSYCCKVTNKQQQQQQQENSNGNNKVALSEPTTSATTEANSANDLKNLFNHMCEYHSDKYFACKHCAIRFQNATDLDDHNEQYHKDVAATASLMPQSVAASPSAANRSLTSRSASDNSINALATSSSSTNKMGPTDDGLEGADDTNSNTNNNRNNSKIRLKRTLTSGSIEKLEDLDSSITRPLQISTGNSYDAPPLLVDPNYEQKLTRRQLKHQVFENIRAVAAASSKSIVSSVSTTLLTRSAAAAAAAATINRGGDETIVTRLNRLPRGRKGTVRSRVSTRQSQVEPNIKDISAASTSAATTGSSLVKTRSKVGFCKLTADEPILITGLQNEQSQPAVLTQRPVASVGRTEPLSCTFDDEFYETVSINVRKNLCCHLDGKLESGPTSPSPISPVAAVPAIRSTVVKSPLNDDSEIHEATALSTLTAFPTLLTAEQYGSDYGSSKMKRPFTKHSWKWKWDSFKKFKYVNEGGKIVKKVKQPLTGLRDLSKLDMWTQLTMRTKHEYIQRQENPNVYQNLSIGEVMREEKRKQIEQLNTILDTRRLPQIMLEQTEQTVIKVEPTSTDEQQPVSHYSSITTSGTTTITTNTFSFQANPNRCEQMQQELSRYQLQACSSSESGNSIRHNQNVFPYFLNLRRLDAPKSSRQKDIILSGEWARPRCYICYGCGAKFDHLKTLEEHKIFRHPYVYSTHYEIVGRELIEGNLFKHFYIPTKALMRHHENRISVSTTTTTTTTITTISRKLQAAIKNEIIDSNSNTQIVPISGTQSNHAGDAAAAATLAEEESMDSITSNSKSSYITSTSKSDCDTDSKLTSATSSTYISTRSSALSTIGCNANPISGAAGAGNDASNINASETDGDKGENKNIKVGNIDAMQDEEANIDVPIQTLKNCSKCKREYNGMLELYRHMLDCSGDYFWMLVKKRKYRYYGSKKRRSAKSHYFACERRKKSSGNKSEDGGSATKRKTVYNPNAPRPPRPSDAESIARMLENLPAKRACRQIFPDLTKPRHKFKHNNAKLNAMKKQILVKKVGHQHRLINASVGQKLRNGKKIMATTSVSAITKNILRNHKKQIITRHLRQQQQKRKQNQKQEARSSRTKKTPMKAELDESKERNKSSIILSSATKSTSKTSSDTEQKSNGIQDKKKSDSRKNESENEASDVDNNAKKQQSDNIGRKTKRFVKNLTQKLQSNKKSFMLKKKVTRSSGVSPLRGLDIRKSSPESTKQSDDVTNKTNDSKAKHLLRKLSFRRSVPTKASVKLHDFEAGDMKTPQTNNKLAKGKEIQTAIIAEEQVDGLSDTSNDDKDEKLSEAAENHNSGYNTSEDDSTKQGLKSKKRKAIKSFFGLSSKNKKSTSPVLNAKSTNTKSETNAKGNKKSNKNQNKGKNLAQQGNDEQAASLKKEHNEEIKGIRIKIEENDDTNTKLSNEELSLENQQTAGSDDANTDNLNSVQVSPTAKRRGRKLNDCIAMLTGKLQEKIQASKSDAPSNEIDSNEEQPKSSNGEASCSKNDEQQTTAIVEEPSAPQCDASQIAVPPAAPVELPVVAAPAVKPRMGFDIASLVKPDENCPPTSSSTSNVNAVITSSSCYDVYNEAPVALNSDSKPATVAAPTTTPDATKNPNPSTSSPVKRKISRKSAKTHKNIEEERNESLLVGVEPKFADQLEQSKLELEKRKVQEEENSKMDQAFCEISKSLENIKEMSKDIEKTLHNPIVAPPPNLKLDHSNAPISTCNNKAAIITGPANIDSFALNSAPLTPLPVPNLVNNSNIINNSSSNNMISNNNNNNFKINSSSSTKPSKPRKNSRNKTKELPIPPVAAPITLSQPSLIPPFSLQLPVPELLPPGLLLTAKEMLAAQQSKLMDSSMLLPSPPLFSALVNMDPNSYQDLSTKFQNIDPKQLLAMKVPETITSSGNTGSMTATSAPAVKNVNDIVLQKGNKLSNDLIISPIITPPLMLAQQSNKPNSSSNCGSLNLSSSSSTSTSSYPGSLNLSSSSNSNVNNLSTAMNLSTTISPNKKKVLTCAQKKATPQPHPIISIIPQIIQQSPSLAIPLGPPTTISALLAGSSSLPPGISLPTLSSQSGISSGMPNSVLASHGITSPVISSPGNSAINLTQMAGSLNHSMQSIMSTTSMLSSLPPGSHLPPTSLIQPPMPMQPAPAAATQSVEPCGAIDLSISQQRSTEAKLLSFMDFDAPLDLSKKSCTPSMSPLLNRKSPRAGPSPSSFSTSSTMSLPPQQSEPLALTVGKKSIEIQSLPITNSPLKIPSILNLPLLNPPNFAEELFRQKILESAMPNKSTTQSQLQAQLQSQPIAQSYQNQPYQSPQSQAHSLTTNTLTNTMQPPLLNIPPVPQTVTNQAPKKKRSLNNKTNQTAQPQQTQPPQPLQQASPVVPPSPPIINATPQVLNPQQLYNTGNKIATNSIDEAITAVILGLDLPPEKQKELNLGNSSESSVAMYSENLHHMLDKDIKSSINLIEQPLKMLPIASSSKPMLSAPSLAPNLVENVIQVSVEPCPKPNITIPNLNLDPSAIPSQQIPQLPLAFSRADVATKTIDDIQNIEISSTGVIDKSAEFAEIMAVELNKKKMAGKKKKLEPNMLTEVAASAPNLDVDMHLVDIEEVLTENIVEKVSLDRQKELSGHKVENSNSEISSTDNVKAIGTNVGDKAPKKGRKKSAAKLEQNEISTTEAMIEKPSDETAIDEKSGKKKGKETKAKKNGKPKVVEEPQIIIEVTPDIASISTSLTCDSDMRHFAFENQDPTSSSTCDVYMENLRYVNENSDDIRMHGEMYCDSEHRDFSADNSLSSSKTDNSPGDNERCDTKKSSLESLLKFRRKPILPPPKGLLRDAGGSIGLEALPRESKTSSIEDSINAVATGQTTDSPPPSLPIPVPTKASKKSMVTKSKKQQQKSIENDLSIEPASDSERMPITEICLKSKAAANGDRELVVNQMPATEVDEELFKVPAEKKGRPTTKASKKMDPKIAKSLDDSLESSDDTKSECSESSVESATAASKFKKGKKTKNQKKPTTEKSVDDVKLKEADSLIAAKIADEMPATPVDSDVSQSLECDKETKHNAVDDKVQKQAKKDASKKFNSRHSDAKTLNARSMKKFRMSQAESDASLSESDTKDVTKNNKTQTTKSVGVDDNEDESGDSSCEPLAKKSEASDGNKNSSEVKDEKDSVVKSNSKKHKKTKNSLSKADAEIIENSFKMGETYMQKMLIDYGTNDMMFNQNQNLKLPMTKGGRKSFDIESPMALSPLQKRRSNRIRTPAVTASEDSQKASASEASQSPKHNQKEPAVVNDHFYSDADDEDDDNKPLSKSLGKSNQNKKTEADAKRSANVKTKQELKAPKGLTEDDSDALPTTNKNQKNRKTTKFDLKDAKSDAADNAKSSKKTTKSKVNDLLADTIELPDFNRNQETKDISDQMSEQSDEPLIKVANKSKLSADKAKQSQSEVDFDRLKSTKAPTNVSVDDSNIKESQPAPIRRMTRRKSVAIEKLNMYRDLDDFQLDDEITAHKQSQFSELPSTRRCNKKQKEETQQKSDVAKTTTSEDEVPIKRSKRLAGLDTSANRNKESADKPTTNDLSDQNESNRQAKKRKSLTKLTDSEPEITSKSEKKLDHNSDDKYELPKQLSDKPTINDQSTVKSDDKLAAANETPHIIRPDSAAKKQRKRRKNELAAIVADQLLESFKEVDKSKINDLKMLENLAYEKSEDLLLTGMRLTPTTKRKNAIAAENKETFSLGAKKETKKDAAKSKSAASSEQHDSSKMQNTEAATKAAASSETAASNKNKKKSLDKNQTVVSSEPEIEPTSKKSKEAKSKKKKADKSVDDVELPDPKTKKSDDKPETDNKNLKDLTIDIPANQEEQLKQSNNSTPFSSPRFGTVPAFQSPFDSFRSVKDFGFSAMQTKSNKGKSEKDILSDDNNSNTSELDSEPLAKNANRKAEKVAATAAASNAKNKKSDSKKPEENINELRSGLESFTFGKGHFGEFVPKLFGAKSFSFGTQAPIAVSSTEPDLALKPHFTNITGPSAFSAIAPPNNLNPIVSANTSDKNSQQPFSSKQSNMDQFFLSIAQQQEQMLQPKKSILRPSILTSVTPAQEQGSSTKASAVSSRDPRLNKNKMSNADSETTDQQQSRLATLRRRKSEHELQGASAPVASNQDAESDCEELSTAFGKDKTKATTKRATNPLKPIAPTATNEDSSEEDNYLAQIANSVKDKIRRESDDEDFKAENDGFELAKSFLINHNRMPRRPSTSLSMRSAPNFHDDRTNDFDDVTNTELIDMDLDDDCSVYTSFSQDVRQKGKLGRRRRRRSILMTRKRRASQTLEISNEIYECEICNKSFKKSNALAKHKMTLAHVSKVSELEYINDTKKRQEESARQKSGQHTEQTDSAKRFEKGYEEDERRRKKLEEERQERKRFEEMKRMEEEKNRQEEQKRREEEKLRLFQEEIKIKEEKRRREEEARIAEEMRRKREEEHLQKELERRRKEEEKRRKEEERLKKEQEKRRLEQEKYLKEELERRRKEELKQKREAEEKRLLAEIRAHKEKESLKRAQGKTSKAQTAAPAEKNIHDKDRKVPTQSRVSDRDVQEIKNAVASIPGFKSTIEEEDESIIQSANQQNSSNAEEQSESSSSESSSESSSSSSSSSSEETDEKTEKTSSEVIKPSTARPDGAAKANASHTANEKKAVVHHPTKNILLNQSGIEPISSPEQNFDRYPQPSQNSRLALNPEERLFYECCNMLKGSETPMVDRSYPICPPTTYANFDTPTTQPTQNKPVTPKSSERFSYMGSEAGANFLHNNPAAYSVKSPMAMLRSSPKPAYPKIDINQFSDISSDSSPGFPKAQHPSHNIGVGNTHHLPRSAGHHITSGNKYPAYNHLDMPGNAQSTGQYSENQLTARTFVNSSGLGQTKDTLDGSVAKANQSQALTSPAHSTSSQGSNQTQTTAYRLKTKAAMKGYDNFKISIPTVGLDMQQALQQSPRTGCKLTALAEIALLENEAPIPTATASVKSLPNQVNASIHSEDGSDDNDDDGDDDGEATPAKIPSEDSDEEPIQKQVPVSNKRSKKSVAAAVPKGKSTKASSNKKTSKPLKLPPPLPEADVKLTLRPKKSFDKKSNKKQNKNFAADADESSEPVSDVKLKVKSQKKIKKIAIPSPALNDDANEMQPLKQPHVIKSKKDVYEFDDSEDTVDKDLQEQILKSNTNKKDVAADELHGRHQQQQQQQKQIVIPERPFKDIGLNDQEIIKFQKPNDNLLEKTAQISPAAPKADDETGTTTSYSDRDDFNYASMTDGEHDDDDDNEDAEDDKQTDTLVGTGPAAAVNEEHDDDDDDDDDDDSSSDDSAVTSKTLGNKSLIMGRIFKKVTSAATSNTVATPVIEERKAALIAEKNAANAAAKRDAKGKKPKLPKEELNKLFDQLRSTKEESASNAGGKAKANKNKDNKKEVLPISLAQQKKPTAFNNNNNNKKIAIAASQQKPARTNTATVFETKSRSRQPQRVDRQVESNKSGNSKGSKKEERIAKAVAEPADNSAATKRKSSKESKSLTGVTALPIGESRAQSREIAKLQTELGMSPEDIVELIGDGKRKSQRRCVSNRPKNIELWSSDEYEEFHSTKDIIALIEEKEKRTSKRRKESQASSRKSSISRSAERPSVPTSIADDESSPEMPQTLEILTVQKKTSKKEKSSKVQAKKPSELRFRGGKEDDPKNLAPATATPATANEKSNQSKKPLPTLKPTPKLKSSESESDFESNLNERGKIMKRRKTLTTSSKAEMIEQELATKPPIVANVKRKPQPIPAESKSVHSVDDLKQQKMVRSAAASAAATIANSAGGNKTSSGGASEAISPKIASKSKQSASLQNPNMVAGGKVVPHGAKISKRKGDRPKNSSGKPQPRRKRVASEMLYYWSSSSDEEYGRLEGGEEEDDDISGEQYQQHGWIVGDSHKKLVTLLAIAKTQKKVEDGGVKETGSKKK